MSKFLIIEETNKISIELKNIINNFNNIIKSKYQVENDIIIKLNNNLKKWNLFYDMLLDYFKNNKLNISNYDSIINNYYLKHIEENKIYENVENIEFINKNISNHFLKKLNKILNNFNIKKNFIYINDLELKIKILLESIFDGFFSINKDIRFSKNNNYDMINKVEITYETEILLSNKNSDSQINTMILWGSNEKNFFNILFNSFFDKKYYKSKIVESWCKIELDQVSKLFKSIQNNNFFNKIFKIFNSVKNEKTLYIPTNDEFYKLNDINFEEFNLNYFENNLDQFRKNLDENIEKNIENLNSLNLYNKPDNKDYFEWKFMTKLNNSDLENKNLEKNIIIHISGGGYFVNWYTYYRHHLNEIIKIKNNILYSIIYRLCPDNDYPSPFNDIINSYFYILNKYKEENIKIILYGDSAGGHLILSLLNFLILSKKRMPNKIVLLYPFLETSRIYFDKGFFDSFKDTAANYKMLHLLKSKIFNKININCQKNIIANPSIYYDFIIKNYPQITLFYSTKDPLRYSNINLFNILYENKVNIKAYEIKHLYHGFNLYFQKFNLTFREINKLFSLFLKEFDLK